MMNVKKKYTANFFHLTVFFCANELFEDNKTQSKTDFSFLCKISQIQN